MTPIIALVFLSSLLFVNADTRPFGKVPEIPTTELKLEDYFADNGHGAESHTHHGRKERCFSSQKNSGSGSRPSASSSSGTDISSLGYRMDSNPSGLPSFVYGSYSKPLAPMGTYPFEFYI